MSDERCETCRFWEDQGEDDNGSQWGWCRRFPPVLTHFIDIAADKYMPAFPATDNHDWCGEYLPQAIED